MRGNRFYRNLFEGKKSFRIVLFETDILCTTDAGIEEEIKKAVVEERLRIEEYIMKRPGFLSSLDPLPDDPLAPPVVRLMIKSSKKAGVGPMASVAGAIVEAVGLRFYEKTGHLILENGGDLFFYKPSGGIVGIYAGKSPFSGKIAIKIPPGNEIWGISTSSGKIGHSLSFGVADAVTVVSHSPSLSDAYATYIGNRIRKRNDVEKVIKDAERGLFDELYGILVICGNTLGIWGLEIVRWR